MKSLFLWEVAKATRGHLEQNLNLYITGVSTDTRVIKTGDLFVPLRGPNYDGHDFMGEAFAKGAVASLCDESRKKQLSNELLNKNIIFVENTLESLLQLSKYYKGQFIIPFIAITGSVGKTTVKDMIAEILKVKFCVHKTQGNYNNEIGLPLTLFNLDDKHEVSVVEIGMSGLGEIKKLTHIISPQIAVITNIGVSHIEKLGSKENIAKAKMEILASMTREDLVVLNADSPELLKYQKTITPKKIFFGVKNGDVRALNVKTYGDKGIEFEICGSYGHMSFRVPIPGAHNVYNALAAIIVGFEMGLTHEEIQEGFLNLKPTHMRLEFKKTSSGLTVIDDTYNASPDSMRAALDMLSQSGMGKKKVCILGDMLELGRYSVQAHEDIGRYAAAKADILIGIGTYADSLARGAISGNMDPKNVFAFESVEEALPETEKLASKCDIILVKASRGMKLEQIVQRLIRGS